LFAFEGLKWRTKCLRFRSGQRAIGGWPVANEGGGLSCRVDAAAVRNPSNSMADEHWLPKVNRRSNTAGAA
jgi:hypothetical protein